MDIGVVRQRTCVFVRAKPGRAASPLAAVGLDAFGGRMGERELAFPRPRQTHSSPTAGRDCPPYQHIPAHGKPQGSFLTTPLNCLGFAEEGFCR